MNPVALITGASRGIGRGIALELAALGWDLIINFVRDAAAAQQTAADCAMAARAGGHEVRTVTRQADLAVAAQRDDLARFARSALGRLDLLVNNAGVAPAVRADLLDADEASFDRLITTNLKGPYFLTQQVAKGMIADGQPPGSGGGGFATGKIVFISSISAYTASVNRGDYCLSKAGVSMLTQLFAVRLAGHGIGVYEIRPGLIDTDMTGPVKAKYDELISGGLTPIPRWGTPEDVGKAVAAIARDLLPFSTGEVINVDGGFHLRRL